ncbi:MAG: hypothetical protein PHW96_02165 [Candidatus Nanoarchaeia archaeon]|nr:hypothetical protein [Candidatus Nanoarchaeia archaeon]
MEKCEYCKKEYDIFKIKNIKYCVECKKCNKTECIPNSRVVRDFSQKDDKGAFVKCKDCNEKIYEETMIHTCPHCKKEIKNVFPISFRPLIRK